MMDKWSVHSADIWIVWDQILLWPTKSTVVGVWESHRDVETEPSMSANRQPARAVCPVTEVEPTDTVSPETETVEDMIRMLLPTPVPTPLQAVPIRSDQDLRIQQLM